MRSARVMPSLNAHVEYCMLGVEVVSVRLRISKPGERNAYVALSYCWGGDQEIKLTKRTYRSMCEGISLPTLPRTLQDAIQVTRSLGFKYVWIDALCIIQDSKRDKEADIAEMGLVYKNAILTIIAMSTDSVQNGFLDRSGLGPCGFRLSFKLPNRRLTDITLVLKRRESASEQTWPLHTRGWALQEFLLLRRKLIFAGSNILWQCQSTPVKSLRYDHVIYQGIESLPPLPHEVFTALPTTGREGAEQTEIWEEIALNFSRRQLTFSEDRLAALAGIAAELKEVWNDEYFAGLWRNDLIWQLGWYVCTDDEVGLPLRFPTQEHRIIDEETVDRSGYTRIDYGRECRRLPNSRPVKYLAPSWSWISVDYPIAFRTDYAIDPRNNMQLEAKFIECIVTPTSRATPLGQISRCLLTLEGRLLKSTLFCDITGHAWGVRNGMDFKEWHDSRAEPHRGDCYYYLRLWRTVPRVERPIRYGAVAEVQSHGMILIRAEDSTFRRVGRFYHRGKGQGVWELAGWTRVSIV